LLFEVFSDKQTMGDEGKIHVDGSVGETTGLRWPARATSANAPIATAGNAVIPCRAIRSEAPGGGRRPGDQTITKYRSSEHSREKKTFAAMLANVAELGAERMEETIGKASLRDAAIGTGVAVDKMLALTGQTPVVQIANVIMPTEQEREERRLVDARLHAIARRLMQAQFA
jgi:hypothetical protein